MKKQINLTGLNKREIREKMHNLEEQGIYFGKCTKIENFGKLAMTFIVENQFMDEKQFQALLVKEEKAEPKKVEYDSRIRTGAKVRVKSTGEEFTLGRLYEYSRSHKIVYCTSDGRKWTPATVHKRCEFVCVDEEYNRKFNIIY